MAAATSRIASQPFTADVGALVVEQAAEILEARDARLALLDADPRWLVLHHAVGPAAPHVGARQPSGAGVLGQVVQRGEAVLAVAGGEGCCEGDTPGLAGAGSVLAVPIRIPEGLVLGAVAVARGPDDPPFADADQCALQVLADLAAARLGAVHESAALRARAQELAVLDPAWRPPVAQAGDFVTVTRRGQIIDADEAACRILGYSRQDLLQLRLVDLIPLPPGVDESQALIPLRERVFQGAPVHFDASLLRRDGRLIPVRVNLQALPQPDGPVVRGVIRDLSMDRQADAQAVRMEKMRLLSEIGSGLAHHLNSPLAVVLGNAEMLLEEGAQPEQRVLLEPIRDAANRIADAVREVHRFARPALVGAWTSVDVNQIAVEAVEAAREAHRPAPDRPIRMSVETQPVPAVYGSPSELREMAGELLSNAVQALPRGGTIVVRTARTDDHVEFSVTDDGVGMSAEVRERCTDPFFTTRRPTGNGFGLTRVYDTVLRHGGQTAIESAEGRGTRVTVNLPIAEAG
ncbi:MAG TPA: ATP-binding protein [Chloroflexota bacterium]|nr:ATP-binding protein [Chloroflexota bacterium]